MAHFGFLEERCRCGHQRVHHTAKCQFEDCECIGFSEPQADIAGVRAEVDRLTRKSVLLLRSAFSTGEDIKEEMWNAVKRGIEE